MPKQEVPLSPQSHIPSKQEGEIQAPIYTMPAKYIPPRKIHKDRKWLSWIILLVVVIIFLTISLVVAFLYISRQQGNVNNTNTNLNVQNTNQNINIRTNQNQNINSGTTLNFNLDPKLNTNIHNDLFNTNTNRNITVNNNTNAFLPGNSDVKEARDKDRDGLTDVEEELYGTKFQLPDSDKDGYVDGTEIRGGFSPVEKDKTVLQSGLALEYTNSTYGWSMQYPKKWIAAPLAQNPAEVLFTSDDQQGEFVEVIVIENTAKKSAADWYVSQYPSVDTTDLKSVTVGGLQGIMGQDGYVYYLANAQYIFTIVYQFGTKTEVHYSTTFEMMSKSFNYTPVTSSSPSNVNTNSTTQNNNTQS